MTDVGEKTRRGVVKATVVAGGKEDVDEQEDVVGDGDMAAVNAWVVVT